MVTFRPLVMILMLLSFAAGGIAQGPHSGSMISIESQFFQLKDQKNYGLVFNGGNISARYSLLKQTGNALFSYEAAFGLGAGFSKGIAGINLHLKPAELSYCFPVNMGKTANLSVGPYVALDYHLQMYPDLQSGHALWFTFFDLGPRFILETRLKEHTFRFDLANSVFGLVSRPTEMNETYYYTMNFFDLVGKLHSNLCAGSFNLLNHTDFELEWRPAVGSKNSLAYRLEYFHYHKEPRLQYLVHAINYRIKLGGKK